MGFIGAKRPRIVMVQALGCPPFVSAFDEQKTRAEHGQDGETVFSNLRTADVLADRPVLRAIMESNGIALAAADDQILTCQKEMAASEGIFMAPQGAAGLVALKQLISDGRIHNDERVVMINAGSGLKYL
jgi:threonine synthase